MRRIEFWRRRRRLIGIASLVRAILAPPYSRFLSRTVLELAVAEPRLKSTISPSNSRPRARRHLAFGAPFTVHRESQHAPITSANQTKARRCQGVGPYRDLIGNVIISTFAKSSATLPHSVDPLLAAISPSLFVSICRCCSCCTKYVGPVLATPIVVAFNLEAAYGSSLGRRALALDAHGASGSVMIASREAEDPPSTLGAPLLLEPFSQATAKWRGLLAEVSGATLYHREAWIELLVRAYRFSLWLATIHDHGRVLRDAFSPARGTLLHDG